MELRLESLSKAAVKVNSMLVEWESGERTFISEVDYNSFLRAKSLLRRITNEHSLILSKLMY